MIAFIEQQQPSDIDNFKWTSADIFLDAWVGLERKLKIIFFYRQKEFLDKIEIWFKVEGLPRN